MSALSDYEAMFDRDEDDHPLTEDEKDALGEAEHDRWLVNEEDRAERWMNRL